MTNNHPEEILPITEVTPEPENAPENEPVIAPVAEVVSDEPPTATPVSAEPTDEAAQEPALASVPEPATDPAPAPSTAAVAPAVVEASAPKLKAEPIAEANEEPAESFADLLNAFERSHSHKGEPGQRQLQGVVVSVSADQVFLDIGYKTEGVLPRSAFENNADAVKPGDSFPVSVTGRNEEHYYELSRFKVAQVRDWSALEQAFAEKTAVVGTLTEVRKGGATVDIGVRAFMPASRSGTKDAAELEKLVGTEITCRITKLDVTEEDVVVDRRVVLEEQARGVTAARHAALKEGDTVMGTVRTLMPYGAFVDLGGIDGLLHVSDISHARVTKPEDVLTVGQELQLRILKIDPETKKISLGLKQLQPEPWQTVSLTIGQRVAGTVTRLADFGAFVEIAPGVEGLIHISEMSYGKKLRHPSDMLKQGDRVDAVVLVIKPEERRISLGLKQTLVDPWTEVSSNFPVGAEIEGPITKLMNFGAFVQLADGVEGLVHISEIVADRRLNHPSDVLRAGQIVKAQVLAVDAEKRQIKLSMKQLIPTEIDEYIAEHKVGDQVSGRVIEQSPSLIHVELGDGIRAICRIVTGPKSEQLAAAEAPKAAVGKPDLSNLSSMLKDRWKGNTPAAQAKPEPCTAGQIRSFKITSLDAEAKKIVVELG
ncbi:MAG: S1 RNA-binding domain-containing protein [Terracidiphilus sp.]|jgi:small subunit ribosomal protein S1